MAKTTLHITNGDGAADIIKACAVEGDVLPWRDPMHHGPFPSGLELDAVSDIRAGYLAGADLNASEARRDFRLRNEHLRAAPGYGEIVLWFEHDLLDQLQIMQILDWFCDTAVKTGTLTMICIDQFPGFETFRGIGQLDCNQMASLFPQRRPVTHAQLQLAKAGWAAFRSPDPRALETFTNGDLSALPFLHASLRRHLQDYPWTRDGLTRTERQLLSLVAGGMTAPGKVLMKNMDFESALYIGDWRTFSHISSLCSGECPLLSCSPDGIFRHPPGQEISLDEFRKQELSLTDAGRDVFSGARNARPLTPRDSWLGGVHLRSDAAMWMWNEADTCLVQVEP